MEEKIEFNNDCALCKTEGGALLNVDGEEAEDIVWDDVWLGRQISSSPSQTSLTKHRPKRPLPLPSTLNTIPHTVYSVCSRCSASPASTLPGSTR